MKIPIRISKVVSDEIEIPDEIGNAYLAAEKAYQDKYATFQGCASSKEDHEILYDLATKKSDATFNLHKAIGKECDLAALWSYSINGQYHDM